MKNLKKQLQEKIPVNSSQAGNKPLKSTQNRADASYKETEEKSSQDGGATVKTLSYTPGVLLKFHCQGRGMTKKELRVRGNKIALRNAVVKLLCMCDIVMTRWRAFRLPEPSCFTRVSNSRIS